MVKLLRHEFDVEKVVSKFAEAISAKKKGEIEGIGKQIFEQYGRDWMKRVHQLGDEYPDRTYEVLLAAADHTNYLFFPHVPQRFIEIAYLSTQDIRTLPILESYARCFSYRMVDCLTFKTLKGKCGDEAANLMPCRHACLTACETLLQDLNIDATVNMEASMIKDGYCQFALRRA
jgi:hypothetical protein